MESKVRTDETSISGLPVVRELGSRLVFSSWEKNIPRNLEGYGSETVQARGSSKGLSLDNEKVVRICRRVILCMCVRARALVIYSRIRYIGRCTSTVLQV